MKKEEVVERLRRCIEKSDIFRTVTLDEDVIADFYIDDNGQFYVEEVKTPYCIENIVSVKCKPEEPDILAGSVRIVFDDKLELWVEEYNVILMGNNLFFNNTKATTDYFKSLEQS